MAALAIDTESISYHEKSAAHLLAKQCQLTQKKKTANLAWQQLLKQHTSRLRLLFRNAHTVSTGRTAVKRD